MLFASRFWEGIADGSITVAFRRWRKRAARPGGRQRIRGGVLAIADVDARIAGYGSRAELLAELAQRIDGDLPGSISISPAPTNGAV